jgi:hypothetical protein
MSKLQARRVKGRGKPKKQVRKPSIQVREEEEVVSRHGKPNRELGCLAQS